MRTSLPIAGRAGKRFSRIGCRALPPACPSRACVVVQCPAGRTSTIVAEPKLQAMVRTVLWMLVHLLARPPRVLWMLVHPLGDNRVDHGMRGL